MSELRVFGATEGLDLKAALAAYRAAELEGTAAYQAVIQTDEAKALYARRDEITAERRAMYDPHHRAYMANWTVENYRRYVNAVGESDRHREKEWREEVTPRVYALNDAAYEAQAKIVNAGLKTLREALQADPFTAWIANTLIKDNNDNEYIHEMLQLLDHLPATAEDLGVLAEDRDWCGVWTEFVERACDAGIITQAEMRLAERC